MGTEFDEHYERLLALAVELDSLLTTYGELRWAELVRRNADLIQRGQRNGVDSMLSAFGGMGSLSDVVIHPINGHQVEDDRIVPVNSELDRLRGDLYSHASALNRLLDQN